MGILITLSGVALRQVIDGACGFVGVSDVGEPVVKFLTERFTDHSQRLTKALQNANERAWKAIEVALGGESLLERCKRTLGPAEDRALSEQVRVFLNASYLTKPSAQHAETFRQALKELRAARSRGLLTGGRLAPDQLAHEAGTFAHFADQQALIDAEWKAVERAAGELRETSPQLYKLLVVRTTSGRSPSILAVAVRYYFRREVETDQALFQGLAFAKWEALQDAQEKGFAALSGALSRQGQRLEGMLDDIVAKIDRIDENTRETLERVRRLEEQIKKLLERFQLQGHELRPSDSMSVRSEGDQQRVRQLAREYRDLPEEQRRRRPELLNEMGVLEAAAGDLEHAQRDFQEAARTLSDPKARAEALHNAYRAALERQQWAEALDALRQAVKLDPGRFAPFPFERYEPHRILGAGGFGVVFLCHDRLLARPVVVKALLPSELDRSVADVFAEARALDELNHPAVIRLRHCDFADTAGTRPYLVMEYFDGMNLDDYVAAHGKVSPDDLLAIARPAAEALQSAHSHGLLHRDVKPGNLLVRHEGAAWTVKLIDFGLALRPEALQGKVSTQGAQARTTIGRSIAGTMHYAAPEQMGQAPGVPVGAYSDVYGFGRTCYYALLKDPDPDDEEKETLPETWRSFLRKCTKKDAAKRPPDFAAVLTELDALHPEGDDDGPAVPPGDTENGDTTAGTPTSGVLAEVKRVLEEDSRWSVDARPGAILFMPSAWLKWLPKLGDRGDPQRWIYGVLGGRNGKLNFCVDVAPMVDPTKRVEIVKKLLEACPTLGFKLPRSAAKPVKNNYSRITAAERVWDGDEDDYDPEEIRKDVKKTLDDLYPKLERLAQVLKQLCNVPGSAT
jgi:serine/threonine protein kinase